jgi:hypothetical protein
MGRRNTKRTGRGGRSIGVQPRWRQGVGDLIGATLPRSRFPKQGQRYRKAPWTRDPFSSGLDASLLDLEHHLLK